jgi:hypothetical protein
MKDFDSRINSLIFKVIQIGHDLDTFELIENKRILKLIEEDVDRLKDYVKLLRVDLKNER